MIKIACEIVLLLLSLPVNVLLSDILENWCRVTVSYMCKYIYKYLLINNLGGYIRHWKTIWDHFVFIIQKEIFIIEI